MNHPGNHVVFVDYKTYVYFRFGNYGQYQGSTPTFGKDSNTVIYLSFQELQKKYPSIESYEIINVT